MNSTLDCIPCFLRQTLEAVRFVTDDEALCRDVLRRVLRLTSEMDIDVSPPEAVTRIHAIVREMTGARDPYLDVKNAFNDMAERMLPELADKVEASDDPLRAAVMLAVAGNVIDFGVDGDLTVEQARRAVEKSLEEPFYGDVEAFGRDVERAERILYLADNAGEIVFDKLLLARLPLDRTTIVVRGGPVLNDVTMEDARRVGLFDLAEVIDNGSNAPGTVLHDCSEDFVDRFRRADLIIAKGQGNYESLSGVSAPLAFLFKVKCRVAAAYSGRPLGAHVLHRSEA